MFSLEMDSIAPTDNKEKIRLHRSRVLAELAHGPTGSAMPGRESIYSVVVRQILTRHTLIGSGNGEIDWEFNRDGSMWSNSEIDGCPTLPTSGQTNKSAEENLG